MSHRRSSILLASALVLGLVTNCARAPEVPPPAHLRVRIATGLPGMTFRPLGEALAKAYAEVLPEMRFEFVETEGSVTNVEQLESGDAELGLALADVAYMGFNGRISELGKRADRIRGIAVLHPSAVHVLVSGESSIHSLSDLKGRRVGVGPVGSGTAVTSAILLRAYGVRSDEVRQRAVPFLSAIDELRSGTLDAVFITAADPVAAVHEAMLAGARLLDIDGAPLLDLRVAYPFLRPATIPANTYAGQHRPVQTVRDDVLLLCRSDLDETAVHDLTRALFDVLPTLAGHGDYLRLVDVRRAPATPVPLHPGAAWYYRERELSR
jgi:TRAP transporter TAXI family solute receptor